MMINVKIRATGAFLVGDFFARKLFINYDKKYRHMAASNEVKKVMRTFPNARPLLSVHERPNSYYLA